MPTPSHHDPSRLPFSEHHPAGYPGYSVSPLKVHVPSSASPFHGPAKTSPNFGSQQRLTSTMLGSPDRHVMNINLTPRSALEPDDRVQSVPYYHRNVEARAYSSSPDHST
ncbi:hypothetical protein Ciccas_004547 [Cichlidogyrus casuarinus]|uniref:Uncharacterized protein n=1 Tax=Cichlidogyrus casuarinus TaxID=1844966 RepID=A0ABD2QB57_9PLAT